MTGGAAEVNGQRPRIVILGGGFAGAYCATGLGRRLARGEAEVVLIDRHNYFTFTPLLVEAGTGSLEPRHAVVPIREFVTAGEFRMAEIEGVDRATRSVRHRLVGDDDARVLEYDHLVLALGSVTRVPAIPGLREHGREMKNLADAVALRDRAIALLELANATADPDARRAMLRMVVVGGNFTGVEVAGEFDEFMRAAARRYPCVDPDECAIMLLELGGRILAPLGEDLSAFALERLRARGIDVRLGCTVAEVGARAVTLSTGERMGTRTVIWCAGIEPHPLVRELGVPLDDRGCVRCERDLRVVGADDVWAIGDAAANPGPDGATYPATAQHAVRQGVHLARNIVAVLRGRATRPCDLRSSGAIAAIGCRTGVARVFGVRLAGFPAWWLWRTVYLLKMPRLSRRVRVALDWTVNLFFSRDYVQLGIHAESDQRHEDDHR